MDNASIYFPKLSCIPQMWLPFGSTDGRHNLETRLPKAGKEDVVRLFRITLRTKACGRLPAEHLRSYRKTWLESGETTSVTLSNDDISAPSAVTSWRSPTAVPRGLNHLPKRSARQPSDQMPATKRQTRGSLPSSLSTSLLDTAMVLWGSA
jgi:hypothetical protein